MQVTAKLHNSKNKCYCGILSKINRSAGRQFITFLYRTITLCIDRQQQTTFHYPLTQQNTSIGEERSRELRKYKPRHHIHFHKATQHCYRGEGQFHPQLLPTRTFELMIKSRFYFVITFILFSSSNCCTISSSSPHQVNTKCKQTNKRATHECRSTLWPFLSECAQQFQAVGRLQ